jgi:hypothetical protein
MQLDEGHDTAHPPSRRHLLQKFEGATDLMVVALIVLLGGAMLFGLLTAGGSPSYLQ